jgi:hypothetical protein
MAHARRYFEHALENDKARAEKVLLWMQALYAVEREAREKISLLKTGISCVMIGRFTMTMPWIESFFARLK